MVGVANFSCMGGARMDSIVCHADGFEAIAKCDWVTRYSYSGKHF